MIQEAIRAGRRFFHIILFYLSKEQMIEASADKRVEGVLGGGVGKVLRQDQRQDSLANSLGARLPIIVQYDHGDSTLRVRVYCFCLGLSECDCACCKKLFFFFLSAKLIPDTS